MPTYRYHIGLPGWYDLVTQYLDASLNQIGLPGLPANRGLLRATGERVWRALRCVPPVPVRVQPRHPVLPRAQGHEGEGDEPRRPTARQLHAQEAGPALLQQIERTDLEPKKLAHPHYITTNQGRTSGLRSYPLLLF